ncbi:MAG: hypothetical protein APF76_09465 [Desulfitibacter sp. BRH_c19]|nr:MAG: hypothetical protein APF76_09465 [Desulfitibacter sp. BRH_c19]
MELKFIVIPILGALIGWITNLLAIKLIFRPYYPITIPLFNYSIQGIIPKRRYEISVNIGKVVEKELLSVQDILPIFESGINDTHFIKNISSIIKADLLNRCPAFFPSKLKETAGNLIEDILLKELPKVLPNLAKHGLENLGDNIDISSIVEEKINNLELFEFEEMLIKITKKELKHIEYLGGVLGFLIGLLQLLLITLLM